MRRLALLILAALSLRPAEAQEGDIALSVKAAYLLKIQPFITWPAAAFADGQSPFTLCVAGPDPFGGLLERAVAGQNFAGRAETVRRLRDAGEAAGCQILYIASTDPLTLRQGSDAVRGRPVLIVTDGVQEADARGMINFLVIDDRVRFTIDDDAAVANGLDISSKLLSLAVSVRHQGVKE